MPPRLNVIRIIWIPLVIPIVTVGLLSGVGSCQYAFGCSCIEPKPPAEAFEESRTVFSGKVISISSNEFSKSVTFDVDRAWKGISKDRVAATTPADSAACGYGFEEGREYLIYSHDDESSLSVIICSRTQPLEGATSDLVVLGEGYQPAQAAEDGNVIVKDRSVVSIFNLPAMIGIGAAIAGIIAFLSIRKYRKQHD